MGAGILETHTVAVVRQQMDSHQEGLEEATEEDTEVREVVVHGDSHPSIHIQHRICKAKPVFFLHGLFTGANIDQIGQFF